MPWKKLLANVTGTIAEELRLRNEYLVTENRILRSKLTGRIRLKDEERRELASIGKQLGRKALQAVATIVKPETILRWHAQLVARKFDGSGYRQSPGRPPVSAEVETLILKFARANRSWGYERISGALKNLGHRVSDTTVANVLRRNGLPPVAERTNERNDLEGVRPQPYGCTGGYRFLHHGSVVPLRISHVLHPFLHPSGYAQDSHCGNHSEPSSGMDG